MSSASESITGSRCKRGFLFFGGSYSGEELIEEFDTVRETYDDLFDDTPIELDYDQGRVGMAMDDGDPMAYARSAYEATKLRRIGYGPVDATFGIDGKIDDETIFQVEIGYDPDSDCLETQATFFDSRADRWRDDVLIDQLF